MNEEQDHIPVLQHEVLSQFEPVAGDNLLDATLGLGGHAQGYLELLEGQGTVIGIEADGAALEQAKRRLSTWEPKVSYVHGSYTDLRKHLNELHIDTVSHVLFDLGVGSHQLSDPERGFSFRSFGPLVMRYGQHALPPSQLTALNVLEQRLGSPPEVGDIITALTADELASIIREYGQERYARHIAGAIRESREEIQTAADLAEIISHAVPTAYEHGRIHPATRTFQALRIAVNRELESLAAALPQALTALSPGGKIAVISFHSLEDRLVKRFFQRESKDCVCPPEQVQCICGHTAQVVIQTKKPITASPEEIAGNPRARPAKLRVAAKLPLDSP